MDEASSPDPRHASVVHHTVGCSSFWDVAASAGSSSSALLVSLQYRVCDQDLCAAGVGWGSLHGTLCAGAPLPDPWRSH